MVTLAWKKVGLTDQSLAAPSWKTLIAIVFVPCWRKAAGMNVVVTELHVPELLVSRFPLIQIEAELSTFQLIVAPPVVAWLIENCLRAIQISLVRCPFARPVLDSQSAPGMSTHAGYGSGGI